MELCLSLGSGGCAPKANSNGGFLHTVAEGDGSSPISAASSFEMNNKRSLSGEEGDEFGQNDCRKKLRLSKEQSSFLEESYKEHNTLSPKQKVALAKKLELRPRQVEVWFQNRRARTKLKQTEVDCEYLKRRCETLSEENRRLEKELQDLKALNSSNSTMFCLQSPATTLTMCSSCEAAQATTVTYFPQVPKSGTFYSFTGSDLVTPGTSSPQ